MKELAVLLWRSPWTPVGMCCMGALAPTVTWWIEMWIAPALVLMAFGLARNQSQWRDLQEAIALSDLWRRQDARWKPHG